jgi:hypothetical protein
MARYQNVRKRKSDADPTPRSRNELIDIEATANRLYLETGGDVIQKQIEALELTAEAYIAQMRAAKSYYERGIQLSEEDKVGWGPTITPYEARMSAANLAKLLKLRREKLAHCRAIVEESEAARKAEEEAKAEPEAADEAPAEVGPEQVEPAQTDEAPEAVVEATHIPPVAAGA